MALCARRSGASASRAILSKCCRLLWLRWRRNELPAGIWHPSTFRDMKKSREPTKEYLDHLIDGTCQTKINFGIHEGSPVGALPTDYLVWLANDFRSDTVSWRWWRDAARLALRERQSVHIGKRKAFILGLIRSGNVDYSLELLRSEATQVDRPECYAALLDLCAAQRDAEQGIKVHNHLVAAGIARNPLLVEHLIDMYAKLGMVDLALQAFESVGRKKPASCWAAIIRCHSENARYAAALEAYKAMDVEADEATLVAVFECCARSGALAEGRVVHACVRSSDVRVEPRLRAAMLEFYAACGDAAAAEKLFAEMETKTPRVCEAMIRAYARAGRAESALEVFRRVRPSSRSREIFVAALEACESLEEILCVREEFDKVVEARNKVVEAKKKRVAARRKMVAARNKLVADRSEFDKARNKKKSVAARNKLVADESEMEESNVEDDEKDMKEDASAIAAAVEAAMNRVASKSS